MICDTNKLEDSLKEIFREEYFLFSFFNFYSLTLITNLESIRFQVKGLRFPLTTFRLI